MKKTLATILLTSSLALAAVPEKPYNPFDKDKIAHAAGSYALNYTLENILGWSKRDSALATLGAGLLFEYVGNGDIQDVYADFSGIVLYKIRMDF